MCTYITKDIRRHTRGFKSGEHSSSSFHFKKTTNKKAKVWITTNFAFIFICSNIYRFAVIITGWPEIPENAKPEFSLL